VASSITQYAPGIVSDLARPLASVPMPGSATGSDTVGPTGPVVGVPDGCTALVAERDVCVEVVGGSVGELAGELVGEVVDRVVGAVDCDEAFVDDDVDGGVGSNPVDGDAGAD
jgi:hypothetical protein